MTSLAWRKSSHSNTQGNECVEVAELGEAVGIRDSKAPHVGHLVLTPEAFTTLLNRAKQDEPTR